MIDALDPSLFIGSSSEALPVARALQAELDEVCEAQIWTQAAFEPTGTSISSLLEIAEYVDFAALVLTPDDSIIKRDKRLAVARDNVIFELGLFMGALGPQRVFIVQPSGEDIQLPSDLSGVSMLSYKTNRRELRVAVGPAATRIRDRVAAKGLRKLRVLSETATPESASRRGLSMDEEQKELNRELDAIVVAAEAQGWTVRTRSSTAFRLISNNGRRYSLPIGSPAETRDRVREYAQQLSSAGLRISQLVLKPVNDTAR